MVIKVCLAGATGWAGSELARSIARTAGLALVAAVSRKHAGRGLGEVLGEPHLTCPVEARGVTLPPPFSAEAVACWISEFWLGMQFADLLDVKDERVRHRAALDAMQWLLESLDARASKRSAGARKRR